MTEKQFRLRNHIDEDIQCEEIEYNGKCITYGNLVVFLNNINEENKYLKSCELYKKNQQLVKMLDNVANYMQREHKEIPIDDFVEWWNNIATGGLEDDNGVNENKIRKRKVKADGRVDYVGISKEDLE